MWASILSSRASVFGVVACVAFAVGFAIAWNWQSNKIEAAVATGRADLEQLRGDYATDLADSQAAAKRLLEAEVTAAKESDIAHQAEVARITGERDARPRTVRVQCPAPKANPVPATGTGEASDPGQPDGAATDPAGMAGDGGPGYRDVDITGIRALTTKGMLVSEQLRALQERCGG